jgi:hypothetical protein
MTMLTLGDTILSMRTGIRKLSKGALLSKNTTQQNQHGTHKWARNTE